MGHGMHLAANSIGNLAEALARQPVLAFFFAASLVAVILFTVWGVYWRGFPQFSDVGLI